MFLNTSEGIKLNEFYPVLLMWLQAGEIHRWSSNGSGPLMAIFPYIFLLKLKYLIRIDIELTLNRKIYSVYI